MNSFKEPNSSGTPIKSETDFTYSYLFDQIDALILSVPNK